MDSKLRYKDYTLNYVNGRKSWRKEYGSLLKNLPAIIENLKIINNYVRLNAEPLRIIDYGCAYGYYLSVLKMINPTHELFGVDLAKEAVEETAKVIGIDHVFWQSCGDTLQLKKNSVDVIYSFDMIEHINDDDNITRFFEECARLIKPTGYIFIRTPNCNLPMKIIYKLTGKSWIYSSDEHPNPFTGKKGKGIVEPFLDVYQIDYSVGSMHPLFKRFPFPQLKLTPWITFVLYKKLNAMGEYRGSVDGLKTSF